MKIKLLDSSVSNKIAAGEVVERPASIVKELAENSIDAGATSITVEIKGGGIDLIRVADNGCGMEEDDVKTAFLRHATSKISVAEDLNDILTLGFRGEALASIAAVARVELLTRTASAQSGTEINISGGAIEKLVSCGCPEGTSIFVRDLFFNTPARRKFLKRPSQEASYINDVIIRIALSNPGVSVRFISEGKNILRTPGDGQMLSCIRAVFGVEASSNVIAVNYTRAGVCVSGYIGKREIQKSNRSSQYLFINGRSVKNTLISSAAQQAYAGRLNIDKFPFFVLEMKMSGLLVDVNVHPTKQEVRFADGLPIYDIVTEAVSGALNKNQEIPTLFDRPYNDRPAQTVSEIPSVTAVHISPDEAEKKPNDGQTKRENAQPSGFKAEADNSSVFKPTGVLDGIEIINPKKPDNDVADFVKFISGAASGTISVHDSASGSRMFADKADNNGNNGNNDNNDNNGNNGNNDNNGNNGNNDNNDKNDKKATAVQQDINGVAGKSATGEALKQNEEAPEQTKLEIDSPLPEYSVVGVLFDTYIVLTAGDDAYIIDQHAAHERLLFERFFEKEGRECASQLLLIPYTIKVSPAEEVILEDYLPSLASIGFEIENMGFGSFAIKATPAALEDTDCQKFVTSLLDEHNSIKSVRTNELKRERLMQLACKSAVKAGDKLSQSDIKKLIRLIVKERVPLSCPHGRPILISLTKHELEVRFKRIQ